MVSYRISADIADEQTVCVQNLHTILPHLSASSKCTSSAAWRGKTRSNELGNEAMVSALGDNLGSPVLLLIRKRLF